MKAIGFRAEPAVVHWAVVEGTVHDFTLVEHDKFGLPKAYDLAPAILWVQERVSDIIDRLEPSVAAVRFAETYLTRKPSKPQHTGSLARARVEGAILAAAASKGLEVRTGQIQQIKSRVGSRRAKEYIQTGQFRGVDLGGIPEKRREAVLTAVSGLGHGDETNSND
jgi:Holliday junction resolvasome RuvABC endonuclease subunit